MKTLRVLWLLNHTTLRTFEVDQLNALGVNEIFMPKRFPYDEGNLSADVDFSFDAGLTIPASQLEVLNAQDWYVNPSEEAWRIANLYFDIAVIGFFAAQITSAVRHFGGAIVLRVFGVSKGYSYSQLLYEEAGEALVRNIKAIGSRFWLGAGYEHLKDVEQHFLASRNCFLPVGLKGEATPEHWEGQLSKVMFVCPRIGSSPYFENIYKNFIDDFSDIEYTIGGAQPITVPDKHVIGFVSREVHEYNMRQHRVMFYHSREPNHIHDHPFEAIRAGMPLLFMAGGMLDKMGGATLPGRCKSVAEANAKAKRLINNDQRFIQHIRDSQRVLLEPMNAKNCEQAWQSGFKKIMTALESIRKDRLDRPVRRKRIAVIVPVEYRGGSLRGAKLVANALYQGSRQAGDPADVVFLHLDNSQSYPPDAFRDLEEGISIRSYEWSVLDAMPARRAMRYAGHEGWEPKNPRYLIVDDGINDLQDCDAWLVISDRLSAPLLPLRPSILMVYDYIQRYTSVLAFGEDQPNLEAARAASRVLVTTEFTQQDALNYAGVPERKVFKLPMLAPDFFRAETCVIEHSNYFVWTTNSAIHKNHVRAVEALNIYYEELGGTLECRVTGVDTKGLFKSRLPHLKPLANRLGKSTLLRARIKLLGELPEREYQAVLSRAAFLWHAGSIDNGTFSVIEAASLGVPSLSSDYPAMREIDQQFSLTLNWMRSDDPAHMASQLKDMELTYLDRRTTLPSCKTLGEQSVERLASAYWQVVRECL
ncbi:glycosytransferase [Pseudomonas sp. IB20]|uniref:glycosytransferase n=1 Tax=Pseudomonas TaxID=286 RepID=UPI000BA16A84|nr:MULTISPECIES: glycosytransferase [unclassified Pseudomonas]MCV2226410.1 glycosytransferase [Pseudomonas sp. AU10]OZO05570.1 glycosytransferase [Pseudomonas sp. IB20]